MSHFTIKKAGQQKLQQALVFCAQCIYPNTMSQDICVRNTKLHHREFHIPHGISYQQDDFQQYQANRYHLFGLPIKVQAQVNAKLKK